MSDAPIFERYLGIDYSGAKTPTSSLKWIRVYSANWRSLPEEVPPPPSSRKYWTRRGLAEWLIEQLRDGPPTLIGIDHAFSFPLAYFEEHRLPCKWDAFLDDFKRHWPTNEDIYVECVRKGKYGDGADLRYGDSHWKRLTDDKAKAKSIFHFDIPGQVAKSTHAGLPWLRLIRKEVGGRVHFWPFDGWELADKASVVVEVYPSLWSGEHPREDRTPDQHDAWSVASWLRAKDLHGELAGFFKPPIREDARSAAEIEGWILGVPFD